MFYICGIEWRNLWKGLNLNYIHKKIQQNGWAKGSKFTQWYKVFC